VADGAGGDVFAFLAGERAVVDGELHGDGRRIDLDEGERFHVRGADESFADVDAFDAGCDADDAARGAAFGVGGGEAGVAEGFLDPRLHLGAVFAGDTDVIPSIDGTTGDFADGDAADEVVPLDVGDEHGERGRRIGFWRGDELDDFLEER